jgi:hypothetical protein
LYCNYHGNNNTYRTSSLNTEHIRRWPTPRVFRRRPATDVRCWQQSSTETKHSNLLCTLFHSLALIFRFLVVDQFSSYSSNETIEQQRSTTRKAYNLDTNTTNEKGFSKRHTQYQQIRLLLINSDKCNNRKKQEASNNTTTFGTVTACSS